MRIPELLYAHFEDFCIIATRRIDGEPLAPHRNAFTLSEKADSSAIMKLIAAIAQHSCDTDWQFRPERRMKIPEYTAALTGALDETTAARLMKICDAMPTAQQTVFSHGDRLPCNIVRDKRGEYWFIDWEWAGMRQRYYDLTLFALFADEPLRAVAGLPEIAMDEYMLSELYRDALQISLREIKNWLAVSAGVPREKYLAVWKNVLAVAIDAVERFRS